MMRKALKMEIDWEVNREELTIRGEKSKHYALTRSDNGQILSVCSEQYEPFYNKELVRLVERIENLSNFTCIGFEQFQKGKRILAFLKDTKPSPLVNAVSDHYLIIGNSHDQSSKVFLGLSNFMHRCENQFSRALYDLRIKHTQRIDLTDRDILLILEHYEKGKKKQMYLSKEFSKIEMGENEVHEFLNHMFPEQEVKKSEWMNKDNSLRTAHKRRDEMKESIQSEMKDLGKNAWGLFNGVTYYTSHRMRRGNAGFGNTNGTAQQLNARAWEYCKKLVSDLR